MEFDLGTCLLGLNRLAGATPFRYVVVAKIINRDILHAKIEPATSLALMMVLGSYTNFQEALDCQTRASSETGVESVLIFEAGKPEYLKFGPTSRTAVYERRDGADLEEIRASLENARRRKAEVQSRLEAEYEQRKDPESMASLIQLIYLYASHRRRMTQHQEQIDKSQKLVQSYYGDLVSYFTAHPEALDNWEMVARPQLQERGELAIFEAMQEEFGQIRDAITTNIQRDFFGSSDEDLGEELPEILHLAGGRGTASPSSSSSPAPAPPLPTFTDLPDPSPPASGPSKPASGPSLSPSSKVPDAPPSSRVPEVSPGSKISDGPKPAGTAETARAWKDVLVGNMALGDFGARAIPRSAAAPGRSSPAAATSTAEPEAAEFRTRGRPRARAATAFRGRGRT